MAAVVEFWNGIVNGFTSAFVDTEPPLDVVDTERKQKSEVMRLTCVRQLLCKIAEDTIADPEHRQRCYDVIINEANSNFISLFDAGFNLHQRPSRKVAGQYLPFCLKTEIEQFLSMATSSSTVTSISSILDSEEKFELLCLYLLWTSDTVVVVAAGAPAKHKKLLTTQSHGCSDGFSSVPSIDLFGHTQPDTKPPLSRSSSNPSSKVHQKNLSFTSNTDNRSVESHKDGLVHTGRWWISYRSVMSSRCFVIDLRLLHENDLIPTSCDNMKKMILRGNQHLIDSLVSKDSVRFDVECHESGVLYLKQRRFEIGKYSLPNSPLKQFDDLTLKSFGLYSLAQAQLIARRSFALQRKKSAGGIDRSSSSYSVGDSTIVVGSMSLSRSDSNNAIDTMDNHKELGLLGKIVRPLSIGSNSTSRQSITTGSSSQSSSRSSSCNSSRNGTPSKQHLVDAVPKEAPSRMKDVECFSLVLVCTNLYHLCSRKEFASSIRGGEIKPAGNLRNVNNTGMNVSSPLKPPLSSSSSFGGVPAGRSTNGKRNNFGDGIAMAYSSSLSPFELLITSEDDDFLDDC